jgi:two-component system LytT family response regulator
MPLRALLVDDELHALHRLHQLLQEHGDVEVVAQAGSVEEATALLNRHAVDLVFLDLRLPGADGSALLPHLSAGVEVIFTTAHSDYAVSAFEAGVHDYLLKPFNEARLSLSLERLQHRRGLADTATHHPDDGFWVGESERSDGSLQFVRFGEVLWVEALQNYAHLQLTTGPPVLLKRTMRQWEQLLPQGRFLRLDRSVIVQLPLIERCERQSRSCTLLRFGHGPTAPTLAVGATAASRLQQALMHRPAARER